MHYSFYISSDFCLTAIKWSNVHLYHGENKLHSMRWWCLFCTVCTVEQWLNMLSWSLCVSSEQYVLLCLPCLVRFILITVNYHWHLYRKQLDFLNEILFTDKFQSTWCHDTLSVAKTQKPLNTPLCTAILLIFYETICI